MPFRGERSTGLGKPLKSIVKPLREDIPILLGAEGPKNVAMAAEIADGWLPIFFGPKSDPFYRAALEEGFKRPGARHSWDDFEIVCTVPVIVGDDVEGCADFLRPMMALYIGGMGARDVNFHFDVFARLGHEEACQKIQDAYLDGRKSDAIAAVPTELVEDIALVGPTRQGARRTRAVEGHRAHDDARLGAARTPRPDRRTRRLTLAEAGTDSALGGRLELRADGHLRHVRRRDVDRFAGLRVAARPERCGVTART